MALQVTGTGFQLQGDLTFQNVRSIWDESRKLFATFLAIEVDLSEVSHCDSAALALLIEWKRLAVQNRQLISFKHLPDQLIRIAQMSGVDHIFR